MLARCAHAIFLVSLLSSCTYRYGTESITDIGRYLSLQPGISTKQDVYERFGQPHDVRNIAGGSAWFYASATSRMHGATFVPYVGLFAGGSNVDVDTSLFVFDTQERFQAVETKRQQRYRNMWVGLGEDLQSIQTQEQQVRAEMARLGACLRIRGGENLTSQNAPGLTIGDLVGVSIPPKSVNFGISRTGS